MHGTQDGYYPSMTNYYSAAQRTAPRRNRVVPFRVPNEPRCVPQYCWHSVGRSDRERHQHSPNLEAF